MTRLETRELSLAYDRSPIVERLSLTLPPGAVTALLGRNGSGKSTLLRGLSRLLAPAAGVALLDGQAVHLLPTRSVAQRLGLLPQGPEAPPGMTVRQLVALGRHPHRRWHGLPGPGDAAIIDEAIGLTGLGALAERAVDTLSGGQRQRAWIALAVAQQTEALLLDEPTTFLDPAHQLEVLSLVRRLHAERGLTVVMVLHDLNLAARFADHLVVLDAGRVIAEGAPGEVLTVEFLRRAYGVLADVITDPRTGRPVCMPYGLAEAVAESGGEAA